MTDVSIVFHGFSSFLYIFLVFSSEGLAHVLKQLHNWPPLPLANAVSKLNNITEKSELPPSLTLHAKKLTGKRCFTFLEETPPPPKKKHDSNKEQLSWLVPKTQRLHRHQPQPCRNEHLLAGSQASLTPQSKTKAQPGEILLISIVIFMPSSCHLHRPGHCQTHVAGSAFTSKFASLLAFLLELFVFMPAPKALDSPSCSSLYLDSPKFCFTLFAYESQRRKKSQSCLPFTCGSQHHISKSRRLSRRALPEEERGLPRTCAQPRLPTK